MFKSLSSLKTRLLIMLAVVGPGIITAFADNDAAGVATYSVSASIFGYPMLAILIPITIVLLITQEIGARIAIVTGKGLGDLIREYFGVRVSMYVFALLFAVNFGVIIQDLGGLKSAMQLFNLDYRIFLPLTMILLFLLLTKANYAKIERIFLVLVVFYASYIVSAVLAKPDWSLALKSLVTLPKTTNLSYLYTSIAVLGTTVTAWGQFFINSYIKDKKTSILRLKYSQWEVYIGAILTDTITFFIMLAVIATTFVKGIKIESASDAALAIAPLAGQFASVLFGVGLFVAGFLGCAIVPLATAYAFSEFFGYEGSLDNTSYKKSILFYSFFVLQIALATIFILLPQISLFKITLYANFLNGIFLPIIFFFLYKIANNASLMGKYKNNLLQNVLLVGSAIVITIGSLIGGVGQFFNL